MEFFKTPGANLVGGDKLIFDEVKSAVDGATNDFLVGTNWDANLRCVELINPLKQCELLTEINFLLRKKLRSSTPHVVKLTLQLLESLANNCNQPNGWHKEMNEEKFCRELSNLAIKYQSKQDKESREVLELALDLIQAWGEAFLPKRKHFPRIVEMYFELRKQGLPFKTNKQFDPSRMPIFNSSLDIHVRDVNDITSGILAASLESEAELKKEQELIRQRNQRNIGNVTRSRGATSTSSTVAYPASNLSEFDRFIDSITNSSHILKDLILVSNSLTELKQNDLIHELYLDLKNNLQYFDNYVEKVIDQPDKLNKLLKVNEDYQLIVDSARDILTRNSMTNDEFKLILKKLLDMDKEEKNENEKEKEKENSTANLLDFDPFNISSPAPASVPASVPASAPAPVSSPQVSHSTGLNKTITIAPTPSNTVSSQSSSKPLSAFKLPPPPGHKQNSSTLLPSPPAPSSASSSTQSSSYSNDFLDLFSTPPTTTVPVTSVPVTSVPIAPAPVTSVPTGTIPVTSSTSSTLLTPPLATIPSYTSPYGYNAQVPATAPTPYSSLVPPPTYTAGASNFNSAPTSFTSPTYPVSQAIPPVASPSINGAPSLLPHPATTPYSAPPSASNNKTFDPFDTFYDATPANNSNNYSTPQPSLLNSSNTSSKPAQNSTNPFDLF